MREGRDKGLNLNFSNFTSFFEIDRIGTNYLNRNSYFCHPKREGVIAQLVEQWTENPCVAGSTPARTTLKA